MVLEIATDNAVRMAQQPRKWRKTYLREWRMFNKRTQESVAAQMGFEQHSQLSKIENGKHPYNQQVLEVAALEYGCSVQDLLTRPPGPTDIPVAARQKRRA